MNIQVYDNLFQEKIMDNAIKTVEACKDFYPLHPTDVGFKLNWTFYNPKNNIKEFTSQPMLDLWNEVKKVLPEEAKLSRAYVNAQPFGIEDYIHQDDTDLQKGLTVIVYLTPAWLPEWFGQTVFFKTTDRLSFRSENDIIKSVLPKYNRVLVFDKDIPHCVSPLSKKFMGIRFTCMFKIEL